MSCVQFVTVSFREARNAYSLSANTSITMSAYQNGFKRVLNALSANMTRKIQSDVFSLKFVLANFSREFECFMM